MKKRLPFFIYFLLLLSPGICQSVQADFSVKPSICISENVDLVNQSSNADRYEWDLCQGDLTLTPTGFNLRTLGGSVTTGVDIVFDGSNWYGFVTSQGTNSIIRLDFGSDIHNTPIVVNLGNISGNTNSPTDIKVVVENGNWYGFVYGISAPLLSRINFGSALTNVPTADVVVTGAGSVNGGFDIQRDNSNWNVVFTLNSSFTVIRLASINATPLPADIISGITNPYGNTLGDIVLQKDGVNYYGYTVAYGNKTLQKLNFGSSLFTTPSIEDVSLPILSGVSPYGIDTGYDNGNYYLFISTLEGSLLRVDLGSDLTLNTSAATNLGNLTVLENTLKFRIVKHKSEWLGFSPSWATTQFYRVSFPVATCQPEFASVLEAEHPVVAFSSAGQKSITLRAFKNSGEFSEHSNVLIVTPEVSPTIDFTYNNICANSLTTFTPVSSGTIALYDWDFGDAATSTDIQPTHQYGSKATYPVELAITADNGCHNFVRKSVSMYDIPVADFSLPGSNPLCTNQNLLFNNTSVIDNDHPVAWEWTINGAVVSNNEDLIHAFTSTSNQEIKLKASLTGCSTEKIENISTLVTGPVVEFSWAGQCEDANVVFTNNSSGTITGYSWNFDDGQISTLVNPVNAFANPGVYDVVLTASNAAGCNNTASKQLTIYSVPQVNFTALAPPFSCSGTPTQYNDLTPPPVDSNLNSWNWNFGDIGSPSNTSTQRNPQHTYATAADYTVELTVTTNFSCSGTLQKTVTIHPAPTAAFNHSALCEDAVVTFSDAASTNQAWSWQIGSSFYFTENPEHTFSNAGNYEVILSVTGANNCVGSTSETIIIPNKLNVDFSTLRSCVNQQAEFTDVTNDSSDPITDVSWDFGGLGTSETTPTAFTFSETGTVNVMLTVTTQSGCAYPVTKSINIEQGPLAAFTATPNEGEGPLTVQFTNTSLNANTFNWKFNSTGSASTSPSPTFIYYDAGSYTVELIANDLNSCVDTTRQLIEVLAPSEVNPPAPNPSTGAFTIEWKPDEETKTVIVLVDATGREIRNFEVMANVGVNRYILDITGEQAGLYILKIKYSNTFKTYRLMVFE